MDQKEKINKNKTVSAADTENTVVKLKKISEDDLPLVSVIMPVYNAEAYLMDSVMSLVDQTYKNLEIICVDDGSTDLSLKILNKIKDNNPSRVIKIISQENSGPAAARNSGLDKAEGEYIAFLDSDDYVEPDTYEELTKLALKKNADIVVFGGRTFPDELPWENWITQKISPPNKTYDTDNAGKLALLRENSSKPFMWQHFIKRAILEEKPKLRMNEKFELGEDQIFIFSYFPRANKVVFTDKKLYHFRIRESGSIMSKYNDMKVQKFAIYIEMVNNIVQFWKDNNISDNSGEMTSYFVNFLYSDLKSFPEYLQIKFSKQIVDIFEKNNSDIFFGKGYTYEMAKEIKKLAQKKISNAVDSINSMEKSLNLINEDLPLVSVIMPVYNAEAYLMDSVMSLVDQTYKNLEIICVDDGSTDLSLTILNKIKDNNPSRIIKIISQENSGPAAARNTGLDNADGKYIAFLDSDDYVEPYTYEELARCAINNDADIVVFGGKTFPEELPWEHWIAQKISPPNKIYDMKDAGKLAVLRENCAKPFMWQHFIKRSILEEEPKLRMNEKFELGEDQIFIFSYFPRAEKVVFTDKKLYHYHIRESGSIMNKYNDMKIQKFATHIEMVKNIVQYWKDNNISDNSGEMTSYFINFLYYDLKSFPEYLQIKFSKQIIEIFEENNANVVFGKGYTYEMAKELKRLSQKKSSNVVDNINTMEQSVTLIEEEIQKILSSKAYKIGRLLTPKKERIDENWIRNDNNNRIF